MISEQQLVNDQRGGSSSGDLLFNSLSGIGLWDQNFLPQDDPTYSERLLNEVWRLRQATFLGLCVSLQNETPGLYEQTNFEQYQARFRDLTPVMRRRLTEHPPFRIWLKRTILSLQMYMTTNRRQECDLAERLRDFGRMLDGFRRSVAGEGGVHLKDTWIEVLRFDVDPLIREAVPPSYYFPNERKRSESRAGTAYTLPVFVSVVTTALQRIEWKWPAARRDFARYVRMIVHLPDVAFRSCSAERYGGVILLSAGDESLLELEESLIHEYGHQILYNVMELDPLVDIRERRTFRLPWSGQIRDLYGYFHAFYIYLLLARYLERAAGELKTERRPRLSRLSEIVRGLGEALPELRMSGSFTDKGRSLLISLESEVQRLQESCGSVLRQKKRGVQYA